MPLPKLEEIIIEHPRSGITFAKLFRHVGKLFLRENKKFTWYWLFVTFVVAIEIVLEALLAMGIPVDVRPVSRLVRILLGFLVLGYIPLFLIISLYYFIKYYQARNSGPYWDYVRSFLPKRADSRPRNTSSYWEYVRSYWKGRGNSRAGEYIPLGEDDEDDTFVRTDNIA